MIEFTNNNKPIEEIPQIEQVELHPLEGSFLTISLVSSIAFFGFFLVAISISYLIDPYLMPEIVFIIVCASILFLMFLSGTIKILGFKHKAYGLRDHDILYRSGLIWRSETIVPFNRIQHVEIGQGPLERFFNLGKLKVFTAGGSQSDLLIPGLKYEEANRIKEYLVAKTKQYDQ